MFSIVAASKKKKVEKPETAMTFKDLPSELKQRVALFLPHCDLMKLVQTSESIRSDLDLEIVSSPLTDRCSQNKRYKTTYDRKCFAVVVPKPEARFHSMTFKCHVQGAGGIGRFWITEQDVPANEDPENLKRARFHDNNVVARSLIPSIIQQTLSLTFPVKPNKMYQFHIETRWSCINTSNMSLYRVGFGRKSTECTSYQFDAYEVDEMVVHVPQTR